MTGRLPKEKRAILDHLKARMAVAQRFELWELLIEYARDYERVLDA